MKNKLGNRLSNNLSEIQRIQHFKISLKLNMSSAEIDDLIKASINRDS